MPTENSQNVQDVFLNHVRKNKLPVTIFLVNGVKLENGKYIHASGYVKQNSLNPKDNNFDQSLADMYHSTLSIKKLIQK